MIKWYCKKFDELTAHELYAILQLRNIVFIVEQNCAYPDIDNKDQQSQHYMGWKEGVLVAYTRLLPPGVSYSCCSIGRVVTAPSARGEGTGRLLMEKSIQKCTELFGDGSIKIGAQLYLKKFYESLGFRQTSEIYDEDGIDHIEMLYANGNKVN